MQDDPPAARGPRLGVGGLEHRGGDAAPAGRLAHGQAAELGRGAHHDDPAGGQHFLVRHGDEVQALGVAPVELLAHRHALLDAEDLVAQRYRRLQLLLAAHPPDLEVARRERGRRSRIRAPLMPAM